MIERERVETDGDVVRRVLEGERDAYRLLVQRYQDTLYRTALSFVKDADTAADIVQATLVHAYGRLDTLRDAENFGGWAYRMCMNRCRDHAKSRRRKDVTLDEASPAVMESGERTDEGLERSELRRTLDQALATLNEDAREAFVLKHVEEKSYEEMAELLDASVPALKMRVLRAREALKMALEEVL